MLTHIPTPNAHSARETCRAVESHFAAMRKPQQEEELSIAAFRWMAKLPAELRPIETGRRYARIVNRIAAIWDDKTLALDYLNSLTMSDRTHRQGFPIEIGREITALYRLASDRIEDQRFDPWQERKYA